MTEKIPVKLLPTLTEGTFVLAVHFHCGLEAKSSLFHLVRLTAMELSSEEASEYLSTIGCAFGCFWLS